MAYDASIFRMASFLAFAHVIGSCSQSGLLSCVWSPRYRGEARGQPKSWTRNRPGGPSISLVTDSIDIFSHMVESSDMVTKNRSAPLTRGRNTKGEGVVSSVSMRVSQRSDGRNEEKPKTAGRCVQQVSQQDRARTCCGGRYVVSRATCET